MIHWCWFLGIMWLASACLSTEVKVLLATKVWLKKLRFTAIFFHARDRRTKSSGYQMWLRKSSFNGEYTKWIKLANTLKLRCAMHLSLVKPDLAKKRSRRSGWSCQWRSREIFVGGHIADDTAKHLPECLGEIMQGKKNSVCMMTVSWPWERRNPSVLQKDSKLGDKYLLSNALQS